MWKTAVSLLLRSSSEQQPCQSCRTRQIFIARCGPSLDLLKRTYIRLSPTKISAVLQKNEFAKELNLGSVKSYDTNQLASNSPIEDAQAEGRCLLTTGLLFGIFDGHGGPACGQVVAKRLFQYVAASLLPKDVLQRIIEPKVWNPTSDLLDYFNDRNELVEDLRFLYSSSFADYAKELADESSADFRMNTALEKAFLKLDSDLGDETIMSKLDDIVGEKFDTKSLLMKTLSVAISGAVGIVAHVDSEHLHIANCGDCQAVLGSWNSETADWHPTPLTSLHNAENFSEVTRIYSEHPENEHDTVLRNGRLLGQLIPLRSFGDYRFKWSAEEVRSRVLPYIGDCAFSPNCATPPYLTAKPEVTYHKLRVKDSFLIIASDGLWDMLSHSQAVRLVGEHMSGKTVLSPYKLPDHTNPTLGEIHSTLRQRTESFKVKPEDQNAATHLIRHALGGTEHGIDHAKISSLLTLPDDSVRLFRDDITVTVIFFDSEFLSQRPL